MTKVHGVLLVLATGAALCAGSAASGAELRGTLQGADTVQPAAPPATGPRRLFYWEEPNGAIDVRRPHAIVENDMAVVVSGPGIEESNRPVRLPVHGGRCRPGTAVVVPNGTVDITNEDWFTHEFFATPRGQAEPVASARPEPTPPRSHRQIQIAQPGTYELRDRRQPLFRCWIVVGPGQGRLVRPGPDGAYRTPIASEGDFSVKVLFEGRTVGEGTAHSNGTRDATVPAINVAAAAAPASGGNAANANAPAGGGR